MRIGPLLLALALLTAPAYAQQIAPGSGEQTVTLLDIPFRIATYRPNCPPRLILAVFHGGDRDAGPHRNASRDIASEHCAIVVAPRFEKDKFSDAAFALGGVTGLPGKRPIDVVAPLIAWARTASGQPGLPYALLGHSAGGQYIGRVVAYLPTTAKRIVIANPSTWVLPSATDPVPYGFAGFEESAIRAYLALPIVMLLGQKDTGDGALAVNKEAMAQGANRLERGRNTFALAQKVAAEKKWKLGWTKLEVPNVGHNFASMLESRQALEAFK